MNCALWLNKRKVLNASEIHENLDIASLRGYYLAGSLLEWLCSNGGEEYAERLSEVSPNDQRLNEKLADIFGGTPLPVKTFGAVQSGFSEQLLVQNARGGFVSSSEIVLSSGYFEFASYGSGSFEYLQFTSFGEFWEILQKLQAGSFGSFWLGSYSQWAWLFAILKRGYGSFTFTGSGGSFGFHEWEWEWLYRLFSGSFGSFSATSFGSFSAEFFKGLFGSFCPLADPTRFPELDEYDRIMLETLMRCPLDRFGYGIHNI